MPKPVVISQTDRMLEAWKRADPEKRALLRQSLSDEYITELDRLVESQEPLRPSRWASPVALQRGVDATAMSSPHLDLISDLIVRTETEQVMATVAISVRMAKSTILCKYGPAWLLDRSRNKRIVIGTCSSTLAIEHSEFARDLITTNPGYFSIRVSESNASRDDWGVAGSPLGGLKAIGVNGMLIGRGLDLALIDDPYGNEKDAMSPTIQEDVWNWFNGTIMSRREPGASVIIIMARWHENDLIGKIKRELPGEFEHIELPALAREDDPLGREVGEPLWPARFSKEEMEHRRSMTPAHLWASQYQQQPVDRDNAGLSMDRFGKWALNMDRKFDLTVPYTGETIKDVPMFRFGTVDWANGLTEESDYTVLSIWNITSHRRLIWEYCRIGRYKSPPEELARILMRPMQKGRHFPVFSEAIGIQGEYTRRLRQNGVTAIPVQPGWGNKVVRYADAGELIDNGRVFIPAMFPAEAVKQLKQFPNGKHDDVPDTLSIAANITVGNFLGMNSKDKDRVRSMIKNAKSRIAP
jgi:predicted phage terminase large subunit-like protein